MVEINREEKDNIKLARAKAALSDQNAIDDWQKDSARLDQRLSEAAKELASAEQKKKQAEIQEAKVARAKAQEKLAQLEKTRKQFEEQKRKELAENQQQKDELAEQERQAKVKKIIESRTEIERIREQPESSVSPIRTLTRDAGNAIVDEKLSVAKITLADQHQAPPAKIKRTPTWLIGVSVVLLLGALIVGLITIIQKQLLSQAPLQPERTGLIVTDQQIVFKLEETNKEELSTRLATLLTPTEQARKESLLEIYLTQQVKENTDQGLMFHQEEIGPNGLNSYFDLNLPDAFLRFLSPQMMLGLHYGASNAPFFIFKTTDYANVVAVWLAEENRLTAELLSLFGDQISVDKVMNGFFQDKMIQNHDTRLLLDESNNLIALSAWLDKNTFLVTTNEDTFRKILSTYAN